MNGPSLLDRQRHAAHGVEEPLSAVCTSLLQALPVGIALFGADGTLLRANPAFVAFFDAGASGTITADEVVAPAGDALVKALGRARAGDRVGPVCVPFGRGAPRLMDVTLMPLALGDGTTGIALSAAPVVGLDAPASAKAGAASDGAPSEPSPAWSPDVDALLAEQARRARERRLAAVGQLAAGVMHDVNNALNPIVAAAHLLELNAGDPDAVRDYARRIARAAETAAATAARVGRFIRQEPLADGTYRLVDLAAIAEEVVAMTRPLWAERAGGGVVRLEQDLPAGVHVRGSASELREALLNLVQNALDAMQGTGGVLGVRALVLPHAIALEVTDTGAGMSSEVRERAFEPFFTTKGVRGTGLGLSEVWGVMKRHRGHAEIDSAPAVGTTVRLVFPRPDGGRRASGEMLAIGEARAPRRVLLVEDHEEGRAFMHEVLAADGHHVEAVGTAREARGRIAAVQAPFDVLVTDLGLPDGSGWELVREARLRWPSMRVGVVTGWEPHELRESVPAHFTLRKPINVHDLLACVGTADA